MNKQVDIHMDGILQAAGAYACVECGKCVSVCPMHEMYQGFSIEMSPRGMIKKALFASDIVSDENIWCCTGCNACTDLCPEGVSCRDLIGDLRKIALKRGFVKNARTCRLCGVVYAAVPVLDYLHERLKGMVPDYLDLCPACRRQVYVRRNA